MKSSLRLSCLVLLLGTEAACVRVDTGAKMPTMGSELIDLSRAKEMGKLDDKEYRELRRKVLASF